MKKTDGAQAWPSINMSRSLGDLHAHSQGLSSEAEVRVKSKRIDSESEIQRHQQMHTAIAIHVAFNAFTFRIHLSIARIARVAFCTFLPPEPERHSLEGELDRAIMGDVSSDSQCLGVLITKEVHFTVYRREKVT